MLVGDDAVRWTSAAAQDLEMADTRSRRHRAFRIVLTTPSGAA